MKSYKIVSALLALTVATLNCSNTEQVAKAPSRMDKIHAGLTKSTKYISEKAGSSKKYVAGKLQSAGNYAKSTTIGKGLGKLSSKAGAGYASLSSNVRSGFNNAREGIKHGYNIRYNKQAAFDEVGNLNAQRIAQLDSNGNLIRNDAADNQLYKQQERFSYLTYADMQKTAKEKVNAIKNDIKNVEKDLNQISTAIKQARNDLGAKTATTLEVPTTDKAKIFEMQQAMAEKQAELALMKSELNASEADLKMTKDQFASQHPSLVGKIGNKAHETFTAAGRQAKREREDAERMVEQKGHARQVYNEMERNKAARKAAKKQEQHEQKANRVSEPG